MMPTPQPPQPPQPPQQPSATTARSFTIFFVPPPPPMTVTLQLGDGRQLQLLAPSPAHLMSALLGGAAPPLVVPLDGSASGASDDTMLRALHELFARSQSEARGPPPTSKAFLDQLPLKTWDAAARTAEKYTDCPICLSEFETADQVLSLPCGHAFHKDCGMPWLKDHNVCPTCRYQLPTRDDDAAAKPETTPDTAAPTPETREAAAQENTDPEQEQEPEFERMLRSLLGVRRERSQTFAEPQATRVVRQRVEAPEPTLPGAIVSDTSDDNDAALDSMLEEEANRFVEEEKRKQQDASSAAPAPNDAAMFDDVDLEELLRDAGASSETVSEA